MIYRIYYLRDVCPLSCAIKMLLVFERIIVTLIGTGP